MDHIIRIFSAGKPLETIDRGIIEAIQGGSRVLIKAGNIPEKIPSGIAEKNDQKLESINGVIASWAEGLSQEHGLIWQRVGPDVLFTRSTA